MEEYVRRPPEEFRGRVLEPGMKYSNMGPTVMRDWEGREGQSLARSYVAESRVVEREEKRENKKVYDDNYFEISRENAKKEDLSQKPKPKEFTMKNESPYQKPMNIRKI